MIRSFLFYHYLSLLSIYCLFFLNFVHEDFQREREEKEERERAREIHRIRYEFRTSFGRIVYSMFIIISSSSISIIPWFVKNSFFFCSIVVGRTTRMKKEDVNRERCRAGDEGRLIFMVMASGGAMTPVMTMTMMGGRCDVIVGRPVVPRGSHSWWSVVDERVEARKWGNRRIWLIYMYIYIYLYTF